MEGVGWSGLASHEVAEGEGDEDEGDGGHEEAEDDVAGGFDAGLAGGEPARVDFRDRLVAEQEGQVGSRVEDGVGHGGEERKRAGSDGAVDLKDGEDNIGGEGTIDSNLVPEMIGRVDFSCLTDVLVDRCQEPFDVLILSLIKALELVGSLLTSKDKWVEDISLAARIGGDQVDLGLCLDL